MDIVETQDLLSSLQIFLDGLGYLLTLLSALLLAAPVILKRYFPEGENPWRIKVVVYTTVIGIFLTSTSMLSIAMGIQIMVLELPSGLVFYVILLPYIVFWLVIASIAAGMMRLSSTKPPEKEEAPD